MSSFDQLPTEVQAALATDMTIDITTIGRRSGESRRIEIWFLNVDGVIYITGTPGPRDWFANLAADPSLIFHLKESVVADLPATATIVDQRDERASFTHPVQRGTSTRATASTHCSPMRQWCGWISTSS